MGEPEHISLFTVWTGGRIRFKFNNIRTRLGEEGVEAFRENLTCLPVAKKWKQEDINRYGPANKLDEAFPDEKTLKSFETAILKFKDDISKF